MKTNHLWVHLFISFLVLSQGVLTAAPKPEIRVPPDSLERPEGATVLESRLAYVKLSANSHDETRGEQPKLADKIEVHYTGWTQDGKVFDSSIARGRPALLDLDQLIEGWKEAIPLMAVGEKFRIWVPEELAYQGRPGFPAGDLVFDVELLGLVAAPEATPAPLAPDDVSAIPSDAELSESGLAWKVLAVGQGSETPGDTSRVTVHYTGWTTDGNAFDSSIPRGNPSTFRLGTVISGWNEGLQLMSKGERRRFWIPQELAYQGRSGKPAGMLVFDVELIEIGD